MSEARCSGRGGVWSAKARLPATFLNAGADFVARGDSNASRRGDFATVAIVQQLANEPLSPFLSIVTTGRELGEMSLFVKTRPGTTRNLIGSDQQESAMKQCAYRAKRLPIIVFVLAVLPFVQASPASAATINFSEPAVTVLLTNTFVGSQVTHYSDPLTSFSLDGVTFFAADSFVLRTTFDDRSPLPYSYDFIGENVLQVASTTLNISFTTPVDAFSFGAALNATSAPSQMQVELFGSGNASLGVFTLMLDRTVLSLSGGTNSNSEGFFLAPSVGLITGARLTNFGDGSSNGSQFNWVIDNVGFQPTAVVPEPTSLFLLVTGLVGAGVRRRRKANSKHTC